MNKLSRIGIVVASSIAVIGALQGCVDKDYDLSKDMDLTTNVGGGQLAIPASSLELLTIEKLLDLDPESSIKAVGVTTDKTYGLTHGDYVLVQSGDPSSADFSVDPVNLNVSGTRQQQHVSFPAFPSQAVGLVDRLAVNLGGEGIGDWVQGLNAFENSIDVTERNVTSDIVSITRVETDITIDVNVNFNFTDYSDNVHIAEGFTIEFGSMVDGTPQFEVELMNNIPGCTVKDKHIIYFGSEYTIPSSGLSLPIAVKAINCKGALQNHDFDFASKIVTYGTLFLNAPQVGKAVTMDIITTIGSNNGGNITGKITSVTGVVNPAINIDPVAFDINDIPDFLKENDNKLDIENPQIYLTIQNPSNASLDVNITLTGHYDNQPTGAGIVRQALTIKPGTNKICICRTGKCEAGFTPYTNPGLGNLIMTIPNSIDVDIKAAVVQAETTFALGQQYHFEADNEVVAPLAFGSNLSFTYSDSEDGWDEDFGKYSFNTIRIEMEAENSAPITFTPLVTPLFRNGSHDGVGVKVTGNIPAGTVSSPASSRIEIELTYKGDLNGLDGIEYELKAGDPIPGVAINQAQGLKFTSITARIIGGVTVDLNEL